MEKRYWSKLSNSDKEKLKVLWQDSSNTYQDNYNGFSAWLLDNYNIIIDSKDYIKKETKIFGYIMIVLGCILIGISLAIIIISNNGKNKLIKLLQDEGFNCDYDSTICNKFDYPKKNNVGEVRFDFARNEFGMFLTTIIDNETKVEINLVYNWKLDRVNYISNVYRYDNISSQFVAMLNEYGTFECNGTTTDCKNAKVSIESVKNNFDSYISRANINKDNLK